jgi:hypothetical protein
MKSDENLYKQLYNNIISEGVQLADMKGSKEWVEFRIKILDQIFEKEKKAKKAVAQL